ncbi:MAG: hypothetical protein R3C11_06445 [Planctomycetaceae bacterium]
MESLPPCCRKAESDQSNTPSTPAAPCQCRYQFEQGMLPVKGEFQFLSSLTEAIDAPLEYHSPLAWNVLPARFAVIDHNDSLKHSLNSERARICIWQC